MVTSEMQVRPKKQLDKSYVTFCTKPSQLHTSPKVLTVFAFANFDKLFLTTEDVSCYKVCCYVHIRIIKNVDLFTLTRYAPGFKRGKYTLAIKFLTHSLIYFG